MRKLVSCVVIAAVAGLMAMCQPAQARMQYYNSFKSKYSNLGKADLDKKCGICHGADNKKQRSDYANAIGKALGAKNVKDADAITKALDEAAKGDAGDGKTYGDLLKDGKLPPPYKAE